MNKEEILSILRSVKDEVRTHYKAEIMGIFGSYSRGEQGSQSDVDVLVAFDDGATLFDFVGLGDFLEQKLSCKVDLVSQRALREEIRDTVYEELIAL